MLDTPDKKTDKICPHRVYILKGLKSFFWHTPSTRYKLHMSRDIWVADTSLCQKLLPSSAMCPGHGASRKAKIIASCLVHPWPSCPHSHVDIRDAKREAGLFVLYKPRDEDSLWDGKVCGPAQPGSLVVQRTKHKISQGRMLWPVLRIE